MRLNKIVFIAAAMLAVAACSTEKETQKPVVKPDNPQPEPPSETPLTFTATL
jgi:uncharacterized lipoprotein YajG